MSELETKGALAKAASRTLAGVTPAALDNALRLMADEMEAQIHFIISENAKDFVAAKENGMTGQMLDRLMLDEIRVRQIAEGIRQVAAMESPLGKVTHRTTRPNGLDIQEITTPLGVVGIIYEARPNVTADAAALCLKAGNAVILRGGKEAFRSNNAIVKTLAGACEMAELPRASVQIIEDTGRESALGLMRLNQYLDVIIPRGGAGLIKAVMENATVPAIETGTGNCHVYVDESADLEMAKQIVINGKISRPSVCNATEKLLVHKNVAEAFLPDVLPSLNAAGVEIRGDEKTRALFPQAMPIEAPDWDLEYLDMIIGVKVADSFEEAVAHINAHSSRHSEAIVTQDTARAEAFLRGVDSAAVYVNASTRFTDGFEFGLGAEIGISTQKLHARGPMGLEALTARKFVVRGTGQIRG